MSQQGNKKRVDNFTIALGVIILAVAISLPLSNNGNSEVAPAEAEDTREVTLEEPTIVVEESSALDEADSVTAASPRTIAANFQRLYSQVEVLRNELGNLELQLQGLQGILEELEVTTSNEE